MHDDATLLRRYAVERADDAFAELVRRNLPLVYSAALRRLGGDAHRAQDVAQIVFCALARDAQRISRYPVLTGWLYTATRNAVIDTIRTEKRRRAREAEAHTMQTTFDNDAPADWSQLRPVLDSAMDQLSARDREAVLLRFFQGRPFAEIGTLIGLSEDAARKRVERAVDKLRDALRPRGIASTSAALGALLANQTMAAAPPALAASVTGAALATGSAATTGAGATFVTLTKLQVGLAAAVVAGGTAGLISQQRSLSALRERHAEAQQQIAQLERAQASRAALPGAAGFSSMTAAPTSVAAVPAVAAEPHAAGGRTRTGPTIDLSGVDAIPTPNPYVTPRAELPPAKLAPLPSTPEIARQKADYHRRYDPFFAQRGLTPAQAERFVELQVYQAMAREDLQASVRKAGAQGGTPGVERMRGQLYAPITHEMNEILGSDGYRAYNDYMRTTFYRDGFVARVLPEFSSAGVPLSSTQMEELVRVVAKNDRPQRVRSTDIGTEARIDWNGVAAQARGVLSPEQDAVLRAYAARQPAASSTPNSP